MAEIQFTGYVEEWTKNSPAHPDWAMKVSEPHRKKDGDNYVTVGRTYRTIKAAYGVTIDFTQFNKGDRVEIFGKELTETTEKDGKRYDNLVVKAESVKVAEGYGSKPAAAKTTSVPAGWEPVDADMPF